MSMLHTGRRIAIGRAQRALACGALAALAGCMSAPPREEMSYAPTMPAAQAAAAAPADGAIWHDAQNMELFSDPKAHRAGDILTIVLVENTQASKKASTTTSKKDKTDLAAPNLLGSVASLHGKAASIGLDGERAFDGSGSSSQSNQLSGEITVTVAQRLANGNLLVRGEKWLTINQGQELVRIAGIVRPQDIGPDNTVPSTRVADARIAYTGKGSLADANSKGWLSRFFSSKWMPF